MGKSPKKREIPAATQKLRFKTPRLVGVLKAIMMVEESMLTQGGWE